MKKIVQQIIQSINNKPEHWIPCSFYTGWDAVKKEGVIVGGTGNTKLLSIINVKINNTDFPLNTIEKYYLEKAVLNFYKNCDINRLIPSPQSQAPNTESL